MRMVAALKHGRNSIGVECPSPHRMERGIKGEVFDAVCAPRTLSHAQLQIELKPHTAVEAVAALQETPQASISRTHKKTSRRCA